MRTDADVSAIEHVMRSIQVDRDSVPWPERVQLAERLSEQPAAAFCQAGMAALLESLASDPKPEVRQALAKLLNVVPEGIADRLRPMLVGDVHAFVRATARHSDTQRRESTQARRRVHFSAGQLAEQLHEFERRYGTAAAQGASRYCERFTTLLVGSMLHDLRSILTHLRSNITALTSSRADPASPRTGRVARRAREDVAFLEQTVRDMEEFAAPLDVARQSEKLVDLVRASLEIATENVAGAQDPPRHVQIDVAVPENLRVEAARHLLVPAFANIIKNALEALIHVAPQVEPRIELVAVCAGEFIELSVRDNGIGFCQEEANALQLLTPGRRNKHKRNSTGYGLPNAARKLLVHGGTLSIQSEEGRGTCVTVRLPASRAGSTK